MATLDSRLTPAQLGLLDRWPGPWELIEDMSWQLQGITVLRLRAAAGEVVAKASGTAHHIGREIRAYRKITAPLAGRTPVLLHADAAEQVLVASYLPGRLVEGGPQEQTPGLFRQAGELLALLHRPRQRNNGYDGAVLNKIGDFADRAAGLVPAAQLSAVRRLAAAHRPAPRLLCATHG
ncbi:aminoglycoside phosphotransferase family protein, partial [Arthrobacter deserti]|nr:aminoglycoside phosphotransferase family protein [Arthrobacter deserti]